MLFYYHNFLGRRKITHCALCVFQKVSENLKSFMFCILQSFSKGYSDNKFVI